MQQHYRFADGVSEDEASLIFYNAKHNVIKAPSNMPAAYLLPHTTRR
jgi:hypothetical protein